MSNIYVIGHKSPDLDSVAAAISYANLKNQLNETDIYKPAIAGDINKETKYVLDKFNFHVPEKLENFSDKKIILVDHNEISQMADGAKDADIIEILDHHKVSFSYNKPIEIKTKPWGASCTIIADLYEKNKVGISQSMAGLMLAAILVDTVITKSPTCTEFDKDVINELSQKINIADWHEYGMEIFKVRSDIADLSDEAIIRSDFKDFEFKLGKVGVGQIEIADLSVFADRKNDLLSVLKRIQEGESYLAVILLITDIINEGSQFLVASQDLEFFEKAFETKLENNQVYLPGVLSRKKQVTPKLQSVLD